MSAKVKIIIAFVLLMAFFATVSYKLVEIQILDHNEWVNKADQIQIREIVQTQPRGRIYDRNGLLLAFDIEATSIALDNYHMTRPELLEKLFQQHLGLTAERARQLIYKEGYFTWIARKVDAHVANALKAEATELGIWGLVFTTEWKRVYPQGSLASNIIGFAGVDNTGLEGIELQFDHVLRGREEVREVVRGARGTQLASKIIEAGVPGNDIYLTLDAQIQHMAEREIQEAARYRNADGAYSVVLDPNSGDILAIASDKTYDLNDFQNSTAEQRSNWIVALTVEPGSTFKPFPVLAALEAGTTSPNDLCNADSPRLFKGHRFNNAEFKSYGTVPTSRIMEGSINTGILCILQDMISEMGEEAAANHFHDLLQKFGFGEPLGIDLPGEVGGILRAPEDWWAQDMGSMSIGQSVSVTGVQLAAAYGAFANGGWLRTPQIISRFQSPVGEELISPRNPNPRKIVSDENAAQMRQMMRGVVEGEIGTGGRAKIEGFQVAGKSGTGEKAIPGVGYVDGLYYSLFAGFFPASHPEYVMIVVFDEVKNRDRSYGWYYGGYVSAPVFKNIAEAIIERDQMRPITSQ